MAKEQSWEKRFRQQIRSEHGEGWGIRKMGSGTQVTRRWPVAVSPLDAVQRGACGHPSRSASRACFPWVHRLSVAVFPASPVGVNCQQTAPAEAGATAGLAFFWLQRQASGEVQ